MKGAGLTRKLGIHMMRRLRELARRGPESAPVPQELPTDAAQLPPAPPASLIERQDRRRRRAAAHRLINAGAHP